MAKYHPPISSPKYLKGDVVKYMGHQIRVKDSSFFAGQWVYHLEHVMSEVPESLLYDAQIKKEE